MKLIPYGHQWISQSDINQVVKVLRSNLITRGPVTKKFEEELCKYTGAKFAVAVSSGTAALHIACLATGIKPKDEVITTPITFVATANCVLYCGGIVRFVDVQQDTINIDPEQIEKAVNKRTKAIIPVHFAGNPCDLLTINKIAKRFNLIVIEDAAHALGAQYMGSKIGNCRYSDMTVFSFHPVKTITTGEGGAVLTNSKVLYKKLLSFRNHGIEKNKNKIEKIGPWYYEMVNLGYNYHVTEFQSALGLSQLKKINQFLRKRRQIVNIYNQKLSALEEIALLKESPSVKSSWHIYVIRVKNASKRKVIFNKLQKLGIGVQVHYIPVHLHPFYRQNLAYKVGDFLNAEEYYKTAITIPLFCELNKEKINYIATKIKNVLNKT